jgi:hypothetical protein
MRAAGLFQEPNSYCLNLFIVTSIAILFRPNRYLTFLASVTMFFSESLWGIGAAVTLIFLNELQIHNSLRSFLKYFATGLVAVTIAFNCYLWISKSPNDRIPFTYQRISQLLGDTSLRERYLQNSCSVPLQEQQKEESTGQRYLHFLVGEGLSTHHFTQCLPANGFALLFKSFGAVGILAILAAFTIALRGLTARDKLYAWIAVCLSFTSYPLVTYVIFWMWLPAIIELLRMRTEKTRC